MGVVITETVSAPNSLRTGNLQGKLLKYGILIFTVANRFSNEFRNYSGKMHLKVAFVFLNKIRKENNCRRIRDAIRKQKLRLELRFKF